MTEQTDAVQHAGSAGSPAAAVEAPERDVFDRLADIEVLATVELGSAELLVRDLAGLAPGSVVELDRLVGEPADLKVNGRLFARGEVVVVEDQLGFRITHLVGTPDPATG